MSAKTTDNALQPMNVKCPFVDTAPPIQVVLHNVRWSVPHLIEVLSIAIATNVDRHPVTAGVVRRIKIEQ